MERGTAERWMDGYRDAWISNDPADVRALFTEDAVYSVSPFADPWEGREEIVRRWTAGIQQNVELEYQVLAIHEDLAVIHWHVFTRSINNPGPVEYDGVLTARLTQDGRCREHREWFVRRALES